MLKTFLHLKQAFGLNFAEGSFALAMLKYVRDHHVPEPSAYKVIH